VNVDLVNILFTVAGKKGKVVTNLRKDDFRVFEDEKAQNITNFSSETDLPLTIALLVDTSGSIRDKLKFEQEAAIEFFYSTLQRTKDRALIISFDSGVDLLQDFTDDPEKLADAVRKIRAGGGKTLKKFSEDTGGNAFFPLKLQDLAGSFLDIHDELRSQYQIGYRPSNARMDGTFRRIRIDLADKRFKPRARTGYYMPKAGA